MNEKQIINLIEDTLKKKMRDDENYIRFTFYELRVKYNLTEEETDKFLELIRNKLEKIDFKVYFTGARFIYQNANRLVQPNELMIAIKD